MAATSRQNALTKRWLVISWFVVYPPTLAVVTRQIYEQSFLWWKFGPQMVGFHLAHTRPLLFAGGVLAVLLSHAWLVVLAWLSFRERRWPSPGELALCAVTLPTVLLLWVPVDWWQSMMAMFFGETGN